MKRESARINAQLEAQRCKSRIAGVKKIVDSFRFSLSHPHDFSPSTADVCWIPEVRNTIIDGTDEEFQHCEADLRSRIPELSAAWLKERRKFFLQLLPQKPPSLEHLALATSLFNCTGCREYGMRIEAAFSHYCHAVRRRRAIYYDSEHRASYSSVASANAFYDTPWGSWFPEFEFSAELSVLVREVVFECGENPDTLTTQEMNKKHHRFARLGGGGVITVLNLFEAVSSRVCSLDDPRPHLYRAVRLSTSIAAEMCRVGSCGLTNFRNTYLSKGVFGVASAAGERGSPKAANRATNYSVPSRFTSIAREFLPACKHMTYRTPSDVGVPLGTRFRTLLKKITITETRMLPWCSNAGQYFRVVTTTMD